MFEFPRPPHFDFFHIFTLFFYLFPPFLSSISLLLFFTLCFFPFFHIFTPLFYPILLSFLPYLYSSLLPYPSFLSSISLLFSFTLSLLYYLLYLYSFPLPYPSYPFFHIFSFLFYPVLLPSFPFFHIFTFLFFCFSFLKLHHRFAFLLLLLSLQIILPFILVFELYPWMFKSLIYESRCWDKLFVYFF